MAITLKPQERALLERLLINHFDFSQLKGIAFDLGTDYRLFTYEKKGIFYRQLLTYIEQTEQLAFLISKISNHQENDALSALLAKTPNSLPAKKVEIVLSSESDIEHTELPTILEKKLQTTTIVLSGVHQESRRFLVSMPENAANLLLSSNIDTLDNRSKVVSISAFDSLTLREQKAWHLLVQYALPTLLDKATISWNALLEYIDDLKTQVNWSLQILEKDMGADIVPVIRQIVLKNLARRRIERWIDQNKTKTTLGYVYIIVKYHKQYHQYITQLQVTKNEELWLALFERLQQ